MLRRAAVLALLVAACLAAPLSALAATVSYTFSTPIAGDTVPVTVTMTDVTGGVGITVSIPPGSGDLLGLFGNVVTESLVSGMSVSDPEDVVTQWQFKKNAVEKVGSGNTMSPVKNWDWGVMFEDPGRCGLPLEEAYFKLKGSGITVAQLTGAVNQGWRLGVRIQDTAGPQGSAKIGLPSGTPPNGTPPTVDITSPLANAVIPTSAVPVTGTFTGAGVSVTVNTLAATINGTGYSKTLTLSDGLHTITAVATNAAGSDTESVPIRVDTSDPVVTITAPADPTYTTAASVLVTGTVQDASAIASFQINGANVALNGLGEFSTTIALAMGDNPITAVAIDAAGHDGQDTALVVRGTAPTVAFSTPAANTILGATPATVTGTFAGTAPVTITVNGVAATVGVGTWTASVPLTEGANTLTAVATNAFGNHQPPGRPVQLDTLAPVVTITAPVDGAKTTASSVTVTGTVADASPIASFTINGTPVTLSGGSFSTTVALVEGTNPIVASATDVVGHTGTKPISVVKGTAPTVTFTAPAAGALLGASPAAATGTFTGTAPVAITVNGVAATVGADTWSASVPVVEGGNTLAAEAANEFGTASATRAVTLDTTPPVVDILSPAAGAVTTQATIVVSGTVVDASAIASVVVNGVAATVTGSAFTATVPLTTGSNTLTATATDAVGLTGTDSVSVTRATAPTIAITSPADGFTTEAETVAVSGSVSGTAPLTVTVNGSAATVSGGTFSATVALAEGANTITATATNAHGTASDSVSGTRTAPAGPISVTIETPGDGSFFSRSPIVVAGLVSDSLATVRVNGVLATVTGNRYVAAGVPLVEGSNAITAVATRGAQTATAAVEAFYNLPPEVVITDPGEGDVLREAVRDVEGFVDDPNAFVEINGISAEVESAGRFLARNVPLDPGPNEVRARAVDLLGAQGTDLVNVVRDDDGAPKLRMVFVDKEARPFPDSEAFRDFVFPEPFEGAVVTVAENLAEFRAELVSHGYELGNFMGPIEYPAIGNRYESGNTRVYIFAEEYGPGTVDVEAQSDDLPYDLTTFELLPIESFVAGVLDGSLGFDPVLLHEILPEDFEPKFYTSVGIDVSFGEGGGPPSEGALRQFEATSGSAHDSLDILYEFGVTADVTSPPFQGVVGGGFVTFSGWVATEAAPTYGTVQYRITDESNWPVIETVAEGTVAIADGKFSVPNIPLPAGFYCALLAPVDTAMNMNRSGACFTMDPNAPLTTLVRPLDGEATLDSSATVSLSFAAETTIIDVNGTPDGRVFQPGIAHAALELPLEIGLNPFLVNLESGGVPYTLSFGLWRVEEYGPIKITSPAQGDYLNTKTPTVRGTVPLGTPYVEINGVRGTPGADGVSFAVQVPLREGENEIRAVAFPFFQEGTVDVTVDTMAPQLVFAPDDGTVTKDGEVVVAGLIGEPGRATATLNGVTVTGRHWLSVSQGSVGFFGDPYRFELRPLALAAGPNEITVRAEDRAGNVTQETVTVVRTDGSLVFTAPTAPVAALRTPVTVEALEPVTIQSWYAAGRRLATREGTALTPGVVTLPDIPLVPGANPMRITYQRGDGAIEVLTFSIESTATDSAVIEGEVVDQHTNEPIPGAFVVVAVNGGAMIVAVTDEDGRYRIVVEPGSYMLATYAEGYTQGDAEGVATAGGTSVTDVAVVPTGLPGIQNEVAVIVPPPGTVTDFEALTVVGTVVNPGATVVVNGVAAEVVGNRFTARHIPLAMGGNTIHVTATAIGSAPATADVAVERSANPVLAVRVYSPPEGATIPGGGLTIRGFVSATTARLLVNGEWVPAVEGTFVERGFALDPGTQEITAQAELPDLSQHAQDVVSVHVEDDEPAVSLNASPPSGLVPLAGSLQATANTPFPIRRIDFDIDGDETLDAVGHPSGTIPFSLDEPHIFAPRVEVTTPEGVELSAETRVRVDLAPVVLTQFAHGNPVDLARTSANELAVLDGAGGWVRIYSADGTFLRTFGSSGSGPAELSDPHGLATAPDGRFFVADTGNQRIQVFSAAGEYLQTLGLPDLERPEAVTIDGERLLVADSARNAIVVISLEDGDIVEMHSIASPGSVIVGATFGPAVTTYDGGFLALASSRFVSLSSRLAPEVRPGAPMDVAEGERGMLVADANPSRVLIFDSGLHFRRSLPITNRSPKAVESGLRRAQESVYVADGVRVTEIGLPVESPLPVVAELRNRMASGDVEGALELFHPAQRPTFRRIFEVIESVLPAEAAAMNDFEVYSVRDTQAVVRFRRMRTAGGVSAMATIPMSLVRSPGGTWQVYDF